MLEQGDYFASQRPESIALRIMMAIKGKVTMSYALILMLRFMTLAETGLQPVLSYSCMHFFCNEESGSVHGQTTTGASQS